MASLAFDVASAIEAFLADASHTSLELPHMTTGQRKQTKKLVEQHPELTCESYGFGQDRQLHLFKRREEAVPAVGSNEIVFGELSCELVPDPKAIHSDDRMENTFVDDFVASSFHNAAHEPQAATTTPRARSGIRLDMTPGTDNKRENETPSTTASSNHSDTASATPTPRAEHEMPSQMQVGFATPVLNTFIHYAQPADARIIQSMPHGMFGQTLVTELLGDTVAKADSTVTAPAAAPFTVHELRPAISALTFLNDFDVNNEALAPGAEVVITGLSKLPAFNGLKGTIQSFDEETARFSVLLMEPVGGHKWAKVKRENLDPVMPPPPPLSPCSYFPEVQATPTWDERPAHPLTLTALV